MTTVLAYLDPVTAKLYWNRVLRFLRIRKDDPEPAKPDATRGTDAA
jgi:hypothetical protein